jgi:hypothetical protein
MSFHSQRQGRTQVLAASVGSIKVLMRYHGFPPTPCKVLANDERVVFCIRVSAESEDP